MPYEPYNFPLTGGLDRRAGPLRSSPESFYTLTNMRQSVNQFGLLEPTPRFYLYDTLTPGVYNRTGGANVNEAGTTVVHYVDEFLTITANTLRLPAGTQMKCLEQIAVPATTGLTGGCLLTIVDPATMSVNLGQTYDVEIDGAATFRWRVNGGGWTALVAINATSGNLIDGGTIRLYWLAATGFTVADTWRWRRTDYSDYGTNSYVTRVNGQRYFYTGSADSFVGQGRVYTVEYYPSLGLYAMRSVGYRPVYATRLQVYENHLFCLGLQADLTSLGGSWIRCSDVNNYDNFFPTDTNEADEFNIAMADKTTTLNDLVVLDAGIVQSRMFVLTTSGLVYTDYNPLPTPFSFKFLMTLPSPPLVSFSTVGETPFGLVVCTGSEVYLFDGVAPSLLFRHATYSLDTIKRVVYHPTNREIMFVTSGGVNAGGVLVYQADYKTLYFRWVHFDSASNIPKIFPVQTGYRAGGGSLKIYQEDTAYSQNSGLVADFSSGASFATPTMVTQPIGGSSLSLVKDIQPTFLGAHVARSSSNGTAYSKTTNISFQVSGVLFDTGEEGSTVVLGTWTSTTPAGPIQTVRQTYRAMAYKVAVTGLDSGKPPGQFTIGALETSHYITRNVQPTR